MAERRDVKEIIEEIVRKLVEGYRPQKVILFGSHAYGTARPDSDIDLLIIKETSERFIDRWVTVQGIVSDPTRTIGLDTLVLSPQEIEQRLAVGDQVIAEILEKGQVLYAGG
ncbi:MAG: nucleotidyltransferase domain-containing protein [Deltaproteobacteria bacterium]|nr:nucleotidyltransferase domain-containing protein [Deltaproteobacteria bacterium]MBI3077092.1 nucleotidyltransferase domain-containing protein [Deltaproteobacteria bacterium]